MQIWKRRLRYYNVRGGGLHLGVAVTRHLKEAVVIVTAKGEGIGAI